MDALFARYFDGDLTDREAREFLEAIAADPRLEKELRGYEQVLALGKSLSAPKAPAGFAERVMAQIAREEKAETVAAGGGPERKPFRIPLFGMRWAGVAVAAAAIALAYAGGVYTAKNRGAAPVTTRETRGTRTTTATGVATTDAPTAATTGEISPAYVNQAAAENGLRYVRLVYVPTDPSVERVTVAGSFNNWDPNATPLQRQDGVWSTVLVLPPGSYEYVFFENGARWVTDPLAAQTRDDGFGGSNAVLDVGA
jgi:negative regulator of sigma E activity